MAVTPLGIRNVKFVVLMDVDPPVLVVTDVHNLVVPFSNAMFAAPQRMSLRWFMAETPCPRATEVVSWFLVLRWFVVLSLVTLAPHPKATRAPPAVRSGLVPQSASPRGAGVGFQSGVAWASSMPSSG